MSAAATIPAPPPLVELSDAKRRIALTLGRDARLLLIELEDDGDQANESYNAAEQRMLAYLWFAAFVEPAGEKRDHWTITPEGRAARALLRDAYADGGAGRRAS